MERKVSRATNTVLAFGLVNAPVKLYKTTGKDSDLPDFEAAGPNGGALRMEVVGREAPSEAAPKGDPLAVEEERPETVPAIPSSQLIEDGTGEIVERDQIRKGLRIDEDFVDLTDELKAIEDRTKLDEMRIVSFIRVEKVPREMIQGSYWIAPGLAGTRALRLLYLAMKLQRRVAVVKWTKRTRQSLGVIAPHRSGALMVLEVAWAETFISPPVAATSIQEADVSPPEVGAAIDLVDALADSRDSLLEQEDDALRLRRELIAEVQKGKRPQRPSERPRTTFPDSNLTAALAASIDRARDLV